MASPRPRRAGEGADPVSALEWRIQAAMRAGASRRRDVERVRPFTATFAVGSDHPFLNYAIPDDAAEPTATEVSSLVEAFRSRGRTPRLEYVPSLAPGVEPALVPAGFAVESRPPLMTLGEPTAAVSPAGIELVEAASGDDVRAAVTAQHEAYGEPAPSTDAWLEGVVRSIETGGLLVLARDVRSGEAAGGGQCTSRKPARAS